jgi:integrase
MDVAMNTETAPPTAASDTPEGKRRKPPSAAETMDFTKARIDELLRNGRPQRQKMIWDTRTKGLCVLVSRGPKDKRQATVTFRVVYYLKDSPGRPRYKKLGRYPNDFANFDIDVVRETALKVRNDARQGIDPRKPKLTGDTRAVEQVIDLFIKDHAKNTRTGDETARMLRCYVVTEWAGKDIESITKTDVSDLLNRIARGDIKSVQKSGESRKIGTPAVARSVRTQLSVLFNWYVDEHGSDAFRTPVVKTAKLKQWRPKDRDRVLCDDEIRALWEACDTMGAYGAAVKTMLLVGQRVDKVGSMRRRDIKDHYVIPAYKDRDTKKVMPARDIGHVWDASRPDDPPNKGVSAVPLPALALDIINAVPVIAVRKGQKAEDYVFTTTGTVPLGGLSKYKARLDGKMLTLLRQWAEQRGDDPKQVKLEPWQLRDLRRTARTLMSRAGVDRDIAEHCLAHKQRGVEGIYDRYKHLPGQRDAFRDLAEWIEHQIVNPPEGANVVPLRR